MKKLIPFLIIILMLFGSCKKDVSVPEVTPEIARDFLYIYMNSYYYWYNLMPTVTKENYSDPYKLMDAMMYKTLDRWSFVADYDDFMAEMQGTFVGHGFRIGLDNDLKARIAMIYKNSPLYSRDVRRGWIVKKINDQEIAPILYAGDAAAYNAVIGPGTAGITNTFLFQKPDGTETTIVSTKSEFTINSVILYDTLHLSSGTVVGHLVFESFIEPSENELGTAFKYFYDNNVKGIIIDLRYNSGGYLYIAQILASYLAGNGFTSTIFASQEFNDKHQSNNSSGNFISTFYPMTLSKIVVITSRYTASASEVVMNSLRPHLTVVSIGDTTNGKPVGMNSYVYGQKYIFAPITFKILNSLKEGDYFDGFPPARIAIDDITHDFDDRNEECLKDAINYLETGTFPGKGVVDFSRHTQFSEKPAWMNNVFVLDK